jgi:hypothetical protein
MAARISLGPVKIVRWMAAVKARIGAPATAWDGSTPYIRANFSSATTRSLGMSQSKAPT